MARILASPGQLLALSRQLYTLARFRSCCVWSRARTHCAGILQRFRDMPLWWRYLHLQRRAALLVRVRLCGFERAIVTLIEVVLLWVLVHAGGIEYRRCGGRSATLPTRLSPMAFGTGSNSLPKNML